ncbi:MAG: twin-arginine translocation signal domain-containing protein, partial [Candidatus Levybacteria bacterium]|nr:twin-arginine translocation signal domain-containing protein [Candidatus Levybacteria bacterium]
MNVHEGIQASSGIGMAEGKTDSILNRSISRRGVVKGLAGVGIAAATGGLWLPGQARQAKAETTKAEVKQEELSTVFEITEALSVPDEHWAGLVNEAGVRFDGLRAPLILFPELGDDPGGKA